MNNIAKHGEADEMPKPSLHGLQIPDDLGHFLQCFLVRDSRAMFCVC